MKVLLFGATGMVGQGVLLECLRDARVTEVLAVGRTPVGRQHAKLRELVRPDLFDLAPVAADLAGFDACFFCLGVSSTGMKEPAYRRVTKDLTLSVASLLAESTPDMTFVYVSGRGTDSSEHGRAMWARVKGETENALLAMPLRAFMFRPGFIQPMDGITSKTRMYAILLVLLKPLFPLLRKLFPSTVTTTAILGQAMIEVAEHGDDTKLIETQDIDRLGSR
jgi:uncharacterized protein YbjT (DUF2867 family)